MVGRIFKAAASPVGTPWMWTLIYGYHEDRTPTHGYEATRDGAMAAFAKSGDGNTRPTASDIILLGVKIGGRAGKRASGLVSQ